MRRVRRAVFTALFGVVGVAAACDDAGSSLTKSPSVVPTAGSGGSGTGGTGGAGGSGGPGGAGAGAGAGGRGRRRASGQAHDSKAVRGRSSQLPDRGSGGRGGAGGGAGAGGGGNAGGAGGAGGFQEPPTLGPGSCQIVSLQGTLGSSLGVGLLSELDDPALPEEFVVVISSTPALPGPGVYEFAAAPPNVSAHIYESGWFEGAPYGYLAETGYAVLEQVDSKLESKGAVKDLRLRRCNWTYISTPEGQVRDKCVPDPAGPCAYVASYGWDTRVPVGTACTYASQCGDVSIKYCDPLTNTCQKAECGQGQGCGAGLVCTSALFGDGAGLCRPACSPQVGPDACPGGEECVAAKVRPTEGICVPRGTLANGASCDFPALPFNTMCSQHDSYCASGPGKCSQMCAMFGEGTAPACPAGQFCRTTFNGTYCGGNEYVSPAQVGQGCGPDYFVGCAPGGGRLNGFCLYDTAAQDYVCRAVCKVGGPPCAAGTCAPHIDGYVGVCLP
jgi:hypothetical protein